MVNGLDRSEGVALRAAERRKAEESELRLQLADIVAAESEVVREITGAAAMSFVDCKRFLEEGRFQAEHVVTK